jgi:hypothetical protein
MWLLVVQRMLVVTMRVRTRVAWGASLKWMTRETINLRLLSCNDITLYLFSNQIVSLMDLILLHDIVHFYSAVCLHNACHLVKKNEFYEGNELASVLQYMPILYTKAKV